MKSKKIVDFDWVWEINIWLPNVEFVWVKIEKIKVSFMRVFFVSKSWILPLEAQLYQNSDYTKKVYRLMNAGICTYLHVNFKIKYIHSEYANDNVSIM